VLREEIARLYSPANDSAALFDPFSVPSVFSCSKIRVHLRSSAVEKSLWPLPLCVFALKSSPHPSVKFFRLQTAPKKMTVLVR